MKTAVWTEENRAEYEAKTIGWRDEDGMTYTIASLRKAFELYHHTAGTDWKRPVDITIPWESELLVTFCRAIEFYHGDRPKVANAIGGRYGSCRITSRGYMG